MSNPKIVIGQFMRKRASAPDTAEDPYAPGGQVDPNKAFLEADVVKNLTPDLPPAPMGPAKIPFMEAPALSRPSEVPEQKAPSLTLTSPAGPQAAPPIPPTYIAGPQPSLPVTPSAPPADPYLGPIPPPTSPAGIQLIPNPQLSAPPDPGPNSSANPPGHDPDPNAVTPNPALSLQRPVGSGPASSNNPAFHSDNVSQSVSLPQGLSDEERAPDFQLDPADDVQATKAAGDEQLQKLHSQLDSNGRYAFYTGIPVNTPGDLLLDPELYVKQIARLTAQPGKTLIHSAIQATLFAMNRRGKIWNPLTLAPVPGTELFIPAAIDALFIGDPIRDIHAELAEGKYNETHGASGVPFIDSVKGGGGGGIEAVKHTVIGAASQDSSLVDNPLTVLPGKPLVVAALETRNNYNPDAPYSDSTHVNISGLVDAALEKKAHPLLDAPTDDKESPRKLNTSKMFDAPKLSLAKPHEWRLKAGIQKTDPKTDPLARSSFTNGIVPVRFRQENEYGFATVPEKNGSSPIDDDEAYVPLSFTDLRPLAGKGSYRIVYFRPFITSINEGFAPEWNLAPFLGRTDSVATYQSTGRVVNLGFKIAAFSPEDLPAMYQKITWLNSMLYPQFGKDMLYQAGPVVRMRVGNLIDAIGPNGRGLPGIIQALDYDYSESTWELKKGFKLPREITVSLSFLVLHDRPIGRLAEGQFGGLGQFDAEGRFLPAGNITKSEAGADQNDPTKISGISSFRPVGAPEFDPNRY